LDKSSDTIQAKRNNSSIVFIVFHLITTQKEKAEHLQIHNQRIFAQYHMAHTDEIFH